VDEKKKVVNSILKAIAISGVLLATVIYIRMRPPENMKIDLDFLWRGCRLRIDAAG
jgi:hypothetical protein